MEEEAAKTAARKMAYRNATTSVYAVSLRFAGSLFSMITLLWVICRGFELATGSSRFTMNDDWAFHIGVITMVFGFLFLILGLPILADLFLNLSEQLQQETELREAGETKTTCQVIVRIFMSIITMLMLWWTIYIGFCLATDPRRDNKYYLLRISIGMVTIAFGLLYLVIGLSIVPELGLDLLGRWQQNTKKKKGNQQVIKVKAMMQCSRYNQDSATSSHAFVHDHKEQQTGI